jgi:hypothetical protein
MSRQAQAERERAVRVILGAAEEVVRGEQHGVAIGSSEFWGARLAVLQGFGHGISCCV